MSKVLLALTSAALIALSGCATQQATTAKPALSAEAKAALTAAEAAHKDATAKFALWTTADAALKAAKAAAEKGDSATVLKQSKIVQDHTKMGLAQLNYPMMKVGD
jgi:murein lipoprotein